MPKGKVIALEDVAEEIANLERQIASDERQIEATDFQAHMMRGALQRKRNRLRALKLRRKRG